MAARTSNNARIAYDRNVLNSRQMYVYGNAVPKPEYEYGYQEPKHGHSHQISNQVEQNRSQALQMNKAYVVFLAVAAILALIVCVNYIQLRSELTSRSRNITVLQERLASINEENTTKYNVIMDSVNLEEVRTKAMNELGMVYANENQIVQYDNGTGDYIKQYEAIPEEGILASSLDAED